MAAPTGARAQVTLADGEDGALTITPSSVMAAPAPSAVAELDDAATRALLARLEPLPATDAGSGAPALRAPTPPPVRSRSITPIAFAAPGGQPIPDAPVAARPPLPAPLVPPQISPDGAVRMETTIRVRFSEPMVAVAAVGARTTAASATDAPATITPTVPGVWRWIDTRVVELATTAPRLAMATAYTVTVPAGTRALSGAILAADTTTKFSTPGPRIDTLFPSGTIRPDSAIAIRFDQDIDPQALAPLVRIATARGKRIATRVVAYAEAEESWAHSPNLAHTSHDEIATRAKRYVFLAPATRWPAGAELRVQLPAGAPALEGPLRSPESVASIDVARPFVVDGLECDDPRPAPALPKCSANGSVGVRFSNPVDESTYRAKLVQIEGLDFEDHAVNGTYLSLGVPADVGRTHTVVIGDGLVDVYGQPFQGSHRFAFRIGPLRYDADLEGTSGLYVLDPRLEIPQWFLSVRGVKSLRVQLYAVQPTDYFAYAEFEDGTRATPPGKRVYDHEYPIGKSRGGDVRVDLRPALSAQGTGHVITVATVTRAAGGAASETQRLVGWAQVTKLGLTTRFDQETARAYVAALAPDRVLAPVSAVDVAIVDRKGSPLATTRTGADGTSQLDLPAPREHKAGEDTTELLLASAGSDSTFAVVDSLERTVRTYRARWYVTDDRFIYKPGEPLYVKGWLRWTNSGPNPGLTLPTGDVAYALTDERGTKLGAGTAKLTADGGFDFQIDLPKTANLGTASLSIAATRAGTAGPEVARIGHVIDIQEFRTPAYAVTLDDDATHAGTAPLIAGEAIEMAVEAKYYAGGGLPGAELDWRATLRAASYEPPGWDRFGFEPPAPRGEDRPRYGAVSASVDTTLSPASTGRAALGIAAVPGGLPSLLEVDTMVVDVDRMVIRATSRKIVVHPSRYYVGLRKLPGTAATLQAIVTDIDGTPHAGVAIDVTLEGVLGSERWRRDADVVDTQHCKLVSGRAPVPCVFTPQDATLAYTAVARIVDERGRPNATQLQVPWWTLTNPAAVDLALTLDKHSYAPGETAHLTIHSRTLPAQAVVSFARQGVFAQQTIALTAAETPIELPITPAMLPNVHVVVDRFATRVNQHAPAGTPPLPHYDSVRVEVPVSIDSARLTVVATPTVPLVEPGTPATFEVVVTHGDTPVANAEVALIVVDEAVLALTGRWHGSPLDPFYAAVDAGTSSTSTLTMIDDEVRHLGETPGVTLGPQEALLGLSGYGSGSGSLGMSGRVSAVPAMHMGSPMIRTRKDFRATAAFSPQLHTDAHGKVRVTLTMPDSLTRFRIVALATSDTYYFGKGESTLVTQLTLNARTVAPRFLVVGDTFQLPVVVQNLARTPRTVDVAVRAANLTAVGPMGKRITVPAGQRAEIRFDFATVHRGRAVIQTAVVADAFADASQVEVPVWEPATTESFATYGIVDDAPAREALAVPPHILPDVGGVEVQLASTQLQSLTDAYLYLYRYPFECAEQRSSRMLATAALTPILTAFQGVDRPTAAAVAASREEDLKVLRHDQLPDGGWGYYPGMPADPYVTAQVLTALVGSGDHSDRLGRAITNVRASADHGLALLEAQAKRPLVKRDSKLYTPGTTALVAVQLAALAVAGVPATPRAMRLHAAATALDAYPVDAKARVLAIVAHQPRATAIRAALVKQLVALTQETASAATVTTAYSESERWLLVSSPKTTALVLDALMREAPQHALIPKLARGVLDARKHGRWMSTAENVAALTAMKRYFETYEVTVPDFKAQLWLGAAAYAEHPFVGRSTETAEARATWAAVPPGTQQAITVAKTGLGRLYYRIGITYAPTKADVQALDAGFIVRRSYVAIDDPGDVVVAADGTTTIKLGARVRVSVEAMNTTRRYGVSLVDPLPAGLEAVNTNLAVAERGLSAAAANDEDWDHVNTRDDRVEVFELQMAEGSHRFTYLARATTPGSFYAAPAKAEEMYSPETFGRTAARTVVVK